MKKAVLIIAYRNFQDKEYSVTREVLENGGMEVKTAASQKGIAEGVFGLKAGVDLLVAEVNPVDFDAVVFIGGGGALDYLDNKISYNLASETINQNKILAAICIAPVILAKAGLLKNKKRQFGGILWTKNRSKFYKKTARNLQMKRWFLMEELSPPTVRPRQGIWEMIIKMTEGN